VAAKRDDRRPPDRLGVALPGDMSVRWGLGEATESPRRRFNDDRKRVFGRDRGQRIAFLCECSDPACRKAVLLTVAEYDQRRSGLVLHESHR
jgi:hypothetical protein